MVVRRVTNWDRTLEELLGRLDDRHDPGLIEVQGHTLPIGAGTLWHLTLTEPGRGEFFDHGFGSRLQRRQRHGYHRRRGAGKHQAQIHRLPLQLQSSAATRSSQPGFM